MTDQCSTWSTWSTGAFVNEPCGILRSFMLKKILCDEVPGYQTHLKIMLKQTESKRHISHQGLDTWSCWALPGQPSVVPLPWQKSTWKGVIHAGRSWGLHLPNASSWVHAPKSWALIMWDHDGPCGYCSLKHVEPSMVEKKRTCWPMLAMFCQSRPSPTLIFCSKKNAQKRWRICCQFSFLDRDLTTSAFRRKAASIPLFPHRKATDSIHNFDHMLPPLPLSCWQNTIKWGTHVPKGSLATNISN